MKKRILHVMGIMGNGGVESMVVELCKNLDKERFETSIFSYSVEENIKQKIDNKVNLFSLGFDEKDLCGWKFYLHLLSIIKRIIVIFKKTNPDIIHIHTTASRYLLISILSFLFCRNAVFVKTVHTSGYLFTSNTFADKLRLFMEKVSISIRKTHIVGISKQVDEINKKEFSNIAQSFSLIYNGIDIKYFHNASKNKEEQTNNKKIVACYVARVVPGKNHKFLINLWKKIVHDNKLNIQLLFIGDGMLLKSLKNDIKENHLDNNIICLGNTNNIPQILNSCDFAVFPSEFEGFGIALIEKMAAQLPVIVSDIPPFREIITNMKNGIIIDLKNEIEWINNIILLSKDLDLRKTIGEAAYVRSQDYSVEKMTLLYEDLYLKVI